MVPEDEIRWMLVVLAGSLIGAGICLGVLLTLWIT